jgi:surface antigen
VPQDFAVVLLPVVKYNVRPVGASKKGQAMSAEVSSSSPEQQLEVNVTEAVQVEGLRESSRVPISWLRNRLLNAVTTGVMITGGILAGEYSTAGTAEAVTTTYGDLGYPWANAPCQFGDAGGAKCANPNNPKGDLYDWGVYDDNHVFHPYRDGGYEYRNCTDYVKWKEGTIGVSVPNTWGNGGEWYGHASASQKSDTPEAGDAAVKPVTSTDGFGHVAYVESVNGDGTITVSEYNHDAQGHGDTRTGTPGEMGFTKFVNFGIHPNSTTTATPTPGPTFMPTAIQRPSGETDVAVVGPANSLDFYYNPAGTSSWGKASVVNAAYSTPTIVQRSSGETDIVVQGSGNSMDFYYNAPGSPSWGRSPVAAPGYAYSAPAVVQRANGETDIAVQGPSNSLDFYFNAPGSPYWGRVSVAGGGSAYSAPAMIQRPSGETDIVVLGPNNSLDFYYNSAGTNGWGMSHVAIPNWAYSAPAIVQRPTTGETDIAVQGPNNQLDLYINAQGSGGWGRIPAAGPGSTYNAPNPPVILQRPSGETDIAVKGAGDQADMYYNAQGSPDWGESIAAIGGYSLRAPAMVQRPNTGETDLAIVGPNNRLDFYFNAPGSPYWGNIPIAGRNSGS